MPSCVERSRYPSGNASFAFSNSSRGRSALLMTSNHGRRGNRLRSSCRTCIYVREGVTDGGKNRGGWKSNGPHRKQTHRTAIKATDGRTLLLWCIRPPARQECRMPREPASADERERHVTISSLVAQATTVALLLLIVSACCRNNPLICAQDRKTFRAAL